MVVLQTTLELYLERFCVSDCFHNPEKTKLWNVKTMIFYLRWKVFDLEKLWKLSASFLPAGLYEERILEFCRIIWLSQNKTKNWFKCKHYFSKLLISHSFPGFDEFWACESKKVPPRSFNIWFVFHFFGHLVTSSVFFSLESLGLKSWLCSFDVCWKRLGG